MNRFFINAPLALNQPTVLTANVYHHWIKVLRARLGDKAILFNGLGGEYTATLTDIQHHQAIVSLDAFDSHNRTPARHYTLAQVMSKGDRMDYTIQKATELGVSSIQLLTSERCEMRLKYERDLKKIEHWQQIAVSACEQCGMNIIPTILAPLTLEDWLATCQDNLKLVLTPDEQTHSTEMIAQAKTAERIALLVGPEGGLSEQEVNTAVTYGFKRWQLGERILRTETAGMVALALLELS